jgi:hypothetical protein
VVHRAELRAAYGTSVLADGKIAGDDPRKPGVQALLRRHLEFALAQIPVEITSLDLAPAAGCCCCCC